MHLDARVDMETRSEVRLERSQQGLGVSGFVYSLRDLRPSQDNENRTLCPALKSQVTSVEK